MFADLRSALRILLKSPGFAAVAVLSLGLGLGANTAIFGILNGILLRPLPAPNPRDLRLVEWSGSKVSLNSYTGDSRETGNRTRGSSFSHPGFRDLRDSAAGIAEVFAFFPLSSVAARTRDRVGVSQGIMVSGNFFEGYGAKALIGRTLTADDDRPGADPAVVITYRFWKDRFGLDPAALGQRIGINRNDFTIVGVLPPGYVGPQMGDPADIYVPLSAQPQLQPFHELASYDRWWVLVMARLAPGAGDERLRTALIPAFQEALERSNSSAEQPGIELTDGARGMVAAEPQVKPALFALQGIVAVILLIACANLAGLMLARAVARRREFAVCMAIGAGRWRLMRQVAAESLLLAGAGGCLGLVFSVWIKAALLGLMPDEGIETHLDTHMDWRVLLFTAAAALGAACSCALLPALHSSHVDPARDLRGGRMGGVARQRLGRGLVATQAALSLLLLAAAGLLLRTMDNLRAIDAGFDARNVLLFALRADQAGISDEERLAFFDRARESLAAIPGVQAVAGSNMRLVSGSSSTAGYSVPGREPAEGDERNAHVMAVTEGYFKAMGIALTAGREFAPGDTRRSEPVAIVNQAFADRHFRGESAVGRKVGMDGRSCTIVGVCEPALYSDVKAGKPATVYLAARQQIPSSMHFALRCALDPLLLVPAARKAVAAIDPSIPLADISTQQAQIDRSLLLERMFSSLCSSLAALAVLLSCIGLYGLLACSIAGRTPEIGLRMALGARPRDIARRIIGEALGTTAWGAACGLLLAIGLGHIARNAFYGIEPYDPPAMFGAIGCLLGAAVLAAWLPARRASRLDPMSALRAE